MMWSSRALTFSSWSPGALHFLGRSPGALNPFGTLNDVNKAEDIPACKTDLEMAVLEEIVSKTSFPNKQEDIFPKRQWYSVFLLHLDH